ncbi:ComEC/Rec2 family competence protein [Anaerocolumna sp. MB42-C2]|uniref:ComEC/Rec2 family competence protein n=1 Tax=Anaerocolumna sp. MB42-C2 TaxID=3070997 RepID=UPI0027E1B2D5|nr:ComEC/Rec2 family competence protein [Anaerocolumna sp. MB42-C2]WMJ86732.1 ComEC/Rec2 family competence protein [Anaerocolumna sp. MB42-C2]
MKIQIKRILCYLLVITFLVSISGVQQVNAATKYYKMYVNYIDVGESDCVLIQSNGKSMLIDAGNNGGGDDIVDYLKDKKIKKLDYVICTHPHADHIGGMDDVIKTFDIGKVIAPAISNTTETYEDLLVAIKNKGLKITKPVVGTKYTIGKAKFTIIAPNSDDYGDNLNNYSVGLKLTNGKNSFIFIGDNETEAIGDILKNKIDLKADVYMCGHHGSDTSTTADLLKTVSPKYAVISVGKNSYGHPGTNTLSLLADNKITAYRTDENGTIVATSTGTKITFNATATKLTSNKDSSTSNKDTIVYITETGTKYHKSTCSMLIQSKIKTTLKKAKAKGYEPCKKCHPPE